MNFLNEQFTLIATQFHWLRPLWLFALIPAFILCIFLWRQKRKAYQWQQLIAPELLPFLLDGKTVQTKKSLLWGLLLAWIIASVAIAGPSWIKRPTPVEKNQSALVILLDLSYSMISEDIKPSRIARARLKIADILRDRKDGQTALVAYAGEAHTVTPISDDSATIVSLLSSMHPNIMPLQGSNTEDAIARGIQLLHDAGATQGDLLLVTDGVVPEAFDKIQSLLSDQKIKLSILGVGTTQPAPIPSNNGGFLRDNSGAIITTQLNSAELTQLAQRVNGRFHEIANNNSDIDYLKPRELSDEEKPKLERDFDQWIDQGHWFIFLLLPIALFCFRRGLLLSLLLIPILSFAPSESYALGLDDAWLTKDQQAQRELNKGDAKKAAEQFQSPEWKASAQYRAGDYVGAAEAFSKIDTTNAQYNRGNALAKAGKLEDAIKAYDEALKRDANLEDAKKNRALVEKLKQQKDQQKNDKNKDDKNKDENDKDKKDQQDKDDKKDSDKKDENKQDQDSKDQQQKDQEQKDQQDKEKQEKDKQDSKDQDSKNQKDEQQNSQSSAAAKDSAQQSSAANQAQAGQSSSTAAQQAEAQSSAATSAASAEQQAAQVEQSNLTNEQKQALEQWLRRVPDDPGGLLRNKFKYQYQINRQKQAEGDLKAPSNNADQRL
jgi:Ca-activated chloride channel family protein